jgi:hypothetical protein
MLRWFQIGSSSEFCEYNNEPLSSIKAENILSS